MGNLIKKWLEVAFREGLCRQKSHVDAMLVQRFQKDSGLCWRTP